MANYKIFAVATADASTAFQIELDPRAIAAMEELENSNAQGAEREDILQKHLSPDYEKGSRNCVGLARNFSRVNACALSTFVRSTRRIVCPLC